MAKVKTAINFWEGVDPEVAQFEKDLLESIQQMKRGEGRVTTPAQILLRQARAKSGLSQQAFADRIATPVATLRDWEQGRFAPPGGVLCLLRLINNHPELAQELQAV